MGACISTNREGRLDKDAVLFVKGRQAAKEARGKGATLRGQALACFKAEASRVKSLRRPRKAKHEEATDEVAEKYTACGEGPSCCAKAGCQVPVPPAGAEEEEIDCSKAQAMHNPDTDLILNMLDPENGPAAGQPYQVHWLGPPRPPCEKERLATVMALNKIRDDAPEDPEITNILRLVASVFKAPAALCALFDEKRVFISEQEGNVIPCGDFPWRWTLCGWSMAFKNPQILVIQDTLEDARFHNNNKVKAFPFVRFYCGAPLIAANGHRLGTLCFADVKPRKFDQASCVMMNNMSELVARQLEKDLMLKLQVKDNKALRDTYRNLQRAMDCYEHTVVLLDTQADGWKVVYANAAWTKQTGLPREKLLDHTLSDVLEVTDGTALPSQDLIAATKKMKNVKIPMARLRDPSVTRTFLLSFKPAGRQALDDSTMPIGVPNFLPQTAEDSDDDVGHRFYFMTLYPPSCSPATSVASPLVPCGWNLLSSNSLLDTGSTGSSNDSAVITGLELGHLLGRGSFGWVYYGTWFGTPVAVKVIDEDVHKAHGGDKAPGSANSKANGGNASLFSTRQTPISTPPQPRQRKQLQITSSQRTSLDTAHTEAVLAHELKHPYIVATLKYATRMVPMAAAPAWNDYQHTTLVSTPEGGMPAGIQSKMEPPLSLGQTDSAFVSGENGQAPESAEDPNKGWAVIDTMLPEEYEQGYEAVTDAELIQGCQVQPGGWFMDEANGPSPSASRSGLATCMNTNTSTALQQTWMVMEYCDKGCVQDAVDRGWLRTARDCLASQAHMPAVLATAYEIASAMQYLHSNDIVHGDLTGWNVMLSSSGPTAQLGGRGFVAKVADFGLSRSMEMRSRITTKNYGTITHMPPELLSQGVSSHAVDVYSFGVLLWQMYTGSRPWSGLTHGQIIMNVVNQHKRLQWDEHVPPEYKQLAEECMSFEREKRPTFKQVVTRLEEMKEECGV